MPTRLPPRKSAWIPSSPTKVSHHSSAQQSVSDFLSSSRRFLEDETRRLVTEAEALRALRHDHTDAMRSLSLDSSYLDRPGYPARGIHPTLRDHAPPPPPPPAPDNTAGSPWKKATLAATWSDSLKRDRERVLYEGISGVYHIGSPAKAGNRSMNAHTHISTPPRFTLPGPVSFTQHEPPALQDGQPTKESPNVPDLDDPIKIRTFSDKSYYSCAPLDVWPSFTC